LLFAARALQARRGGVLRLPLLQGALVMLRKGGGKSKEDLKAYRPVILLPHCLKCYTNLIMRRMVKHLQQIGRKNASLGVDGGDIVGEKTAGAGLSATNRGFVAGRSTSDCLVALQMAMDTVLANGNERSGSLAMVLQ
jgi:hypothetical protein